MTRAQEQAIARVCAKECMARELVEALEKLVEAANDSDDAHYGTLSTSFVRAIASAAIAKAHGEAA